MIKSIFLLVIITLSLLALPMTALAAETGEGVIEGTLVNKTAGAKGGVAEVEVTLKTYLNNGEMGDTLAKTDGQGYFSFSSLPTGAGYSYQLTVLYQKAEYNSPRISFEKDVLKKTADITVYDSTTSNEAIKVSTAHTIFYAGKDGIQVKEYYLFTNEADKAYVGPGIDDDKRTLRLSVPPGATGFKYSLDLMECCVAKTEDGIADTMAVPPGKREMAYLYDLSPGSEKLDWANKILYPVANYDLLVAQGIQVSTGQLTPGEPVEIQGARFNRFSQKGLNPGDVITASLSNLPKSNKQATIVWVASLMLVLGGGSLALYLLKRRKPQPVREPVVIGDLRQRLLQEMASLDDRFESGRLAEAAYRRQRAHKKAQLIELMERGKRAT